MDNPPGPRRPRYQPIFVKPGSRYLVPTPTAVVAAVLAVVLLVLGGQLLIRTVELARRGVVVSGYVTAARYGGRADFVTVRLQAPADRTDELIAWSGRPSPGSTIVVRYDPGSPGVAAQAGQWPWVTLLLELGGAVFCVFCCWYAASTPWRRNRPPTHR